MNSVILNGRTLSDYLMQGMKHKVSTLFCQCGRKPSLTVILVGDDPASAVYVRNKVRACEKTGIEGSQLTFPADISEAALLDTIAQLNNDPTVDGILVQLPLPKHISEKKVIETISKEKDVDGFHPLNTGALRQGSDCIVPCTPKGIMKMLEHANIDLEGKHAVVVGRSNIVGKPVADLLLNHNATVTIAHSRTKDLKSLTLTADVLIAAVGRKRFITADMVKPGATVIDVGINTDENGKLCGDVDYEAVSEVAGHITPVPGGVGPMTIAMLMDNTIECFEKHISGR